MTLVYHTPLSAQTQRGLGIDPPAPLALADRVRFGELDVLDHVNNAVYFQWFESARVNYMRLAGLYADRDGGQGPRIVIRSGTIHYRREMLLGEDYVVTCGCTAFRTTSFTMHQEVWSGGNLRASFDCVMVLLQPDGSGRYPIPEALKTRFAEVDVARREG
jgi:acyl-CoA thioester hydrolase